MPLVVLALFGLAAWKLGFFHHAAPQKVEAAAERVGGREWLAPTFILVYATLGAFALPVTVLAYGAGAVFGVLRGSLYIWIASMLAATAGYFLARGVLGTAARRLIGRHDEKLNAFRTRNAALTAFRMQLAPIVPFGVATYTAAIAELPPLSFLMGTAIGIIPGTLLSTFIGDRFIAGVSRGDKMALVIAIGVSLVLLALSYAPKLLKKSR